MCAQSFSGSVDPVVRPCQFWCLMNALEHEVNDEMDVSVYTER